jgi:hypothetical protein
MADERQQLDDDAHPILQSRTERRLCPEDMREAVENLSGFFALLRAWAKSGERDCSAGNDREDLAVVAAIAAERSIGPRSPNVRQQP